MHMLDISSFSINPFEQEQELFKFLFVPLHVVQLEGDP